MSAKRAAIRAIYDQVGAPEWAASNLDALADVLRDLSWLPEGDVLIGLPDLGALDPDDAAALRAVLAQAVADSADGPHPITATDDAG